jgi:hypothetical protein
VPEDARNTGDTARHQASNTPRTTSERLARAVDEAPPNARAPSRGANRSVSKWGARSVHSTAVDSSHLALGRQHTRALAGALPAITSGLIDQPVIGEQTKAWNPTDGAD